MNISNNIQIVSRDEHTFMHNRTGLQGFNLSDPALKVSTNKREVNKLEDEKSHIKPLNDNTKAMYANYMKTCQQINIGV